MENTAKEESAINVKTLYNDLAEVETILESSSGSLEYLVEGSASDKEKADSPVNASVTLSMLNSQIQRVRRIAGNNQGLINRLTGK